MLLPMIKQALANAAAERQKNLDAHYERIMKASADVNAGREPIRGRSGRLHAPCDGYVHWETGEVYGAGEFLFQPNYDEWYEKGGKQYGYSAQVFAPVSAFSELSNIINEHDLKLFSGKKIWMYKGEETRCYYIHANHQVFTDAINSAVEEEKKERYAMAKTGRGDAPEGKQTITAKITSLKLYQYCKYAEATIKAFLTLPNGSTASGTLPKALIESAVGDDIQISATFTRAGNDMTHAYYKRPRAV